MENSNQEWCQGRLTVRCLGAQRLSWLLLVWLVISMGCQEPTSPERDYGDALTDKTGLGNHDPATTSPQISGQRRKVRFVYEVEIQDVPANQVARIWIPRPKSGPHQNVTLISQDLPGEPVEHVEPKYGNQYWYTEGSANEAGQVRLQVTYEVSRSEVEPRNYQPLADGERELFLASNQLVPVGGKPVSQLLENVQLPSEDGQKARLIYETVLDHVDYKKPEGQPWGRGDANWVCESGFGNCTDFHSLFNALCRSYEVPAAFEIGFPLGIESSGDVGGYHCWAFFAAENLWHPVDISEADKQPNLKEYYFGRLTADRLAVSRGRDLRLDPPPAAGSLNFLIDPYVEIDGQPHLKMTKQYRYEDIP